MKLLNRINSTGGLQLFQVLRFAGFFITGIAMARTGVPVEEIGSYEKLMLLAAAVSFFWVQGILNTMLAISAGQSQNKSFYFNVFVILSFAALIVYAVMRLASGIIIHVVSDGFLPGYRIICLYILFNTPCYLIEYIYLLRKQQKQLISYGFLSAVFSVCAVVIPLSLGYSVETALAWLVLWAVCRFLWLLRMLLKYSAPVINTAFLKSTCILALPLVFSYLIAGSTDYLDALMVTAFYGDESLAVFRYGAKELPISLLLANALSTAMIPVLSASNENGLVQLKEQSAKLMHLLFPLSIALMVSSQWLYPLVFDERFAGAAMYFNIYLLLVISRTVFPHPVAFAKRQNKAALVISFIEVVFNVTISYLFMLRFGIPGIAAGTVIAHYIEKILMCIFIYRKYKVSPAEYIPLKFWLIYSACISFVYIFISGLY